MSKRPRHHLQKKPFAKSTPSKDSKSPKKSIKKAFSQQIPKGHLQVSRSTMRFLKEGHPWVRRDRFTQGLENFRCGDSATLINEDGQALASALIDPDSDICARVYHRQPNKKFDPAQALKRAWTKRQFLHEDPNSSSYRIVHGEGDFLPGLRIERYGQAYVVVLFSPILKKYLSEILNTLLELDPQARLLVREHFDDLRRKNVADYHPNGCEVQQDEEIIVQEHGCRIICTPFNGLATGLYVDQRGTRQQLRKTFSGKRILNLFAYTGVFSLSALVHGAHQATDVDIASPALQLGARNAELNNVGSKLKQIKASALDFCAQCDEEFDIIICDPPTAAQGHGSWLSKRDYPKLIESFQRLLAPNGEIIAISNTLGREKFQLKKLIQDKSDWEILKAPTLEDDIPLMRGFDEGRPFQIVRAKRTN